MSGLLDGKILEIGSTPLNRLEELPITGSQLSEHIADNTNPHGTQLFQTEVIIDNTVRLKASNNALDIKNLANNDYADLNVRSINLFGGDINQVAVTELNVEDSFINLNSNVLTGIPVADGGMRIIRGGSPSLALFWDESLKRWRVQQQDLLGNFAEYDLAHLGDVYTKTECENIFVNATGDQMTGMLTLHMIDGSQTALTLKSNNAATPSYISLENGGTISKIGADNGIIKITPATSTEMYKPLKLLSESGSNYINFNVTDAANPVISTSKSYFDFVNKIYAPGFDAKSNTVTNVANPVQNTDAVNLGFADNRYVNVTGDTMTGNLTVNANIYSSNDYLRLNYGQANSDGGLVISNSVSNALLKYNNAESRWYAGTEASSSPIVTEASLDSAENTQTIRDITGAMVSSNTESGIAVTYTGTKLNFDVNDPVLSLSGDVTGSATMTNLGNTNIVATVVDDSHNHTNLTGTTQTLWKIDYDSTGVAIKAVSGSAAIRNLADTDYADLHVQSLYVHGATIEIASETMTVADNIIQLNSNITGTPFENAGIEIRRGTSTNAQLLFDESIDKWTAGFAGSQSEIMLYNSQMTESMQDLVGAMVSGNTESGIAVTYDDTNGKLNFDVNDPVISLTGSATGSATMTNLGNTSIAVTVNDSAKVAGLSVHAGVNNEVNKIVRTNDSGYCDFGWINTVSGDASTSTITRVYASYDAYIRYYTPLNFANQILALGSVKNSHTHAGSEITSGVVSAVNGGTGLSSYTIGNFLRANSTTTLAQRTPAQVLSDISASHTSHTHTAVNGLTMQRYASSFTGNTSNRIVYISGFNSTNYSVSITPTSDTSGNLGDVYAVKYDGYFRVYNTGTSVASFEAIVVGSPA